LFLPVSAAQARERATAAQRAASDNYHDATMDQKYNEDECEDDSKGPREVAEPVEFNHAISFVNKVKVYYHNYNQYHHQKCMH
jgi:histone deacetylase complex regulatory component SIN3